MYKIGIVGCGAIASFLHVPAIASSKSFQLAAAVDSSPSRAKTIAQNSGAVECASSLGELEVELDAILISTPPHTRTRLLSEALEMGLDVLCEKPLANSYQEAKLMIEMAQGSKQIAAVFHQYRYWPNRVRIKHLLENGEVGMPVSAEVAIGNPYGWKSESGYTMRKEMVSGGVLINAGIHPLDTLIYWFGYPLHMNYQDDACGALESNVRLVLTFAHNLQVRFRMSRTCRLSNTFKLTWPNFTLELDNYSATQYVIRRESGAEVEATGDPRDDFKKYAVDLYEDFARAISSRQAPSVDLKEGARVIKLIDECYEQKRARSLPKATPLQGLTW